MLSLSSHETDRRLEPETGALVNRKRKLSENIDSESLPLKRRRKKRISR
jgi:hypothetical protein